MYIFSGYVVPLASSDPSTGVDTASVYVQAFDPKTGASNGPSRPLFAAPGLGLGSPGDTSINQMNLYGAAVAPSGEIALVYSLTTRGGNVGLYTAFLNASTGDGSVDGLGVQKIILLSGANLNISPPYSGPRVIWSNSSQTFVVSYFYTTSNMDWRAVAIDKFYPDGQMASGGVSAAPYVGEGISSGSNGPQGNVGESGNLLGVAYRPGLPFPVGGWISILDQDGNLVGASTDVTPPVGPRWESAAGTAQGFVYFYADETDPVAEVFISTAADAGIVGGDVSGEAGAGAFLGFTLSSPAVFGLAIADDVGTGGKGGVGAAMVNDDVSFVYVSADGASHQGPVSVLTGNGADSNAMGMTNFNGSFALSLYSSGTNSAQVVASGICP